MARTWRRLSKDDRAAYGKKQRDPRRDQREKDFYNGRGKNRTAMKHLNPTDFHEWDDEDEDSSD